MKFNRGTMIYREKTTRTNYDATFTRITKHVV